MLCEVTICANGLISLGFVERFCMGFGKLRELMMPFSRTWKVLEKGDCSNWLCFFKMNN